MRSCSAAAALLLVVAVAGAETGDTFELKATETGREVWLNGELFAGYRTDSGGRPVVWPLVGSSGVAMTRSFPVGPLVDGESDDHPHHRGVWVGYDQVNGFDFWHDPPPEGGGRRGRQVHQRFVEESVRPHGVRLVTENLWVGPEQEAVAVDRRTLFFSAESDAARWVDFTITLRAAPNGPSSNVRLGDSKEGFFAIRVPDAIKVDAGAGRIVSSTGKTNKAAWGRSAPWVDYQGPIAGSTVGVALFSHPSNFRPSPRWHVRSYGLFAANPFGEAQFPEDATTEQGPITLGEDQTMTLRYRVLLHRGDASEGRVADHFARFAEAGSP
ncbi:MAG: PmoA family protein [Planctomycetota bacterium]